MNILIFTIGFSLFLYFTKPETVKTTDVMVSLGLFCFGWYIYDFIKYIMRKSDENERE